MGKRDTFEKNIRALSGCKSLGKAMDGWKVVRAIDHTRTQPTVSCELCGTHFRHGALVERARPGKSKAVTITVGGVCLDTLLLRQFKDARALGPRKTATRGSITNRYEGLIDYGSWAVWLSKNVPKALANAAALLRYVGITPTKSELKRLLRFHDKTRRFPTTALPPDSRSLSAELGKLPATVTIDEARAIVNGLSPEGMGRMLAARGRQYLADYDMSDVWSWDAAWRRSGKLGQRLVAALACLSAGTEDGKPAEHPWEKHLRSSATAAETGTFVWNRRVGLGLVCGGVDEDNVYVWARNDYGRFLLDAWRLARCPEEQVVQEIEKQAFWQPPSWWPSP